ncbi:MAG: hypothetical protein MJ152_03960, partial [Clostridia bacterium]|nr:hypothetical protein [Clostridia bacterium]
FSPVEDDNFSNTKFLLPQTYFVKLTDNANADFYKAEYMGISGYVKKDKVQPIVGTPLQPYLENINFRIFAEPSRDMRTVPTSQDGSSSQVTYVPLLTRNLTYIGKVHGQELVEGRTDIWYYCKYSAEQDFYGYVYSDFCDKMSTITDNTESVTYLTTPIFEIEQNTASLPLNSKATGIIIAILCVPAVVFVYMMFKGTKFVKQNKNSHKEVIDY